MNVDNQSKYHRRCKIGYEVKNHCETGNEELMLVERQLGDYVLLRVIHKLGYVPTILLVELVIWVRLLGSKKAV